MPSEDIKNLFSRFGNRSGRYHEIVREDQRADSVGRWPLLSAVKVGEVRNIPGVSVRDTVVLSAGPVASGFQRTTERSSGVANAPAPGVVVGTPKLVVASMSTPAVEARSVDAARAAHATAGPEIRGAALLFGRGKAAGAAAASGQRPMNPGLGGRSASLTRPAAEWRDEAALPDQAPVMRGAGILFRTEPTIQINSRPELAVKSDDGKLIRSGMSPTPTSLASPPDRSLRGVFSRIGGQAPVEAEDESAGRAVPVFRRLRRP